MRPQGPPHQGEPRADASAAGAARHCGDEATVGCVQKRASPDNRGETNIANGKTVPEEDFADRMLCNIWRHLGRQLWSSVWSWRHHTAPGSTSSGILR